MDFQVAVMQLDCASNGCLHEMHLCRKHLLRVGNVATHSTRGCNAACQYDYVALHSLDYEIQKFL